MTDINRLICLNVQLEGLLKVLMERDNMHARSALAEIFEEYSSAMHQYLDEPMATGETVPEPVAEEPASEVKELEAVESEPEDEEQPAAAAEEPECLVAVNEKLFKAFTLNDKFRFRRELFNGDDDDFNDTLTLLAHMPSYEEAIDYLTNDLLWDKRNTAVTDFFDILKANMPA